MAEGTKKDTEQKWNGWGYKDSYFYFDKDEIMSFSGEGRYEISGHVIPRLNNFLDILGVKFDYMKPSQEFERIIAQIAPPVRNEAFIAFLDDHRISYSFDKKLRLNRAHGHTMMEIFTLRHGHFARVPDIVVWPKNHDEVVLIVSAANTHYVAIIPIGGGTSVTYGLMCPENESRMIVSVDVSKMNRLLWLDKNNLTIRAEAGCIGVELEQELNNQGFTMGHEPDSREFSTVGGWVATRASGMKRSKYGNIEDMLVHVTMVTPNGVLEKSCQAPRISSGPDIHQFILGSEGTLGIITEATFKICEKPQCKHYGSVVFPTFENGIDCVREITRKKYGPASMRLVDNGHYIISKGFRKGHLTIWRRLMEHIEHLYITSWKGFHPDEVCAMTLVYEGTKEEIHTQEKRICQIAASYGGFSGGAENGRYGYMLTYSIAYFRDLGMEYSCIGESMETSVAWDKVLPLVNNVKELFKRESEKLGVIYIDAFRVTQAYDAGACVYMYYAFNYRDVHDPVETYERIEGMARDVVLASGGSISHHHGVGKIRRKWMPSTVGETGISAMRAVKQALDPKNVFANGNLFEATAKL